MGGGWGVAACEVVVRERKRESDEFLQKKKKTQNPPRLA